ncbi:MAG: cupin domain-containing protein [Burkholderiaceae bacterium]|nr:cupin domain-containing protein [Burkholderiaceae bacterium]
MQVIDQVQPEPSAIPGVAHATWAGSDEGLRHLSVWRQTLAAGAATPPHSHECDEVVMCQAGHGEVHVGGEIRAFGPNQTIILPRDQVHQLFNTGTSPLEILGVFGATPVKTYLPDASELALPWRS